MKKINVGYYFVDIGVISIVAIFGFFLEVDMWIGMLGIILITFAMVISTIIVENKK